MNSVHAVRLHPVGGFDANLAQLVEQRIRNAQVKSSSLLVSSRKLAASRVSGSLI